MMPICVSVSIEKVRRCSNRGAYTADAMSKGNLKEPLRENPCEVPSSIINWITDPRMDLDWAQLILREMERRALK